jgi:D-serine dehydratase
MENNKDNPESNKKKEKKAKVRITNNKIEQKIELMKKTGRNIPLTKNDFDKTRHTEGLVVTVAKDIPTKKKRSEFKAYVKSLRRNGGVLLQKRKKNKLNAHNPIEFGKATWCKRPAKRLKKRRNAQNHKNKR